ncbi:Ubx domain-containing protein [Mycoemilia scoparia]|uniref:Ubx domain-containing protein n=1 Tax=Mycoemilia scoparia TaxID=417184 RepID=A0A9W8A2W9_9FUNG|nr:Ubx domain-containing protein [Mycoemilia scoparia]
MPTEDENGLHLLDSLESPQRETLSQYCNITNNNDITTAMAVLSSCSWNLEDALQEHFSNPSNSALMSEGNNGIFESTEPSPSIDALLGDSGLRQRRTQTTSDDPAAFPSRDAASIASNSESERNGGSVSEGDYSGFVWYPLYLWPLDLSLQMVRCLVKTILAYSGQRNIESSGIPPYIGSLDAPTNQEVSTSPSNVFMNTDFIITPISDPFSARSNESFNDWLDRCFGTSHPTFFNGSYQEALQQAMVELKCLVIVFVSPEHDHNCNIGTIFTSPAINDYFNQDKFLLWGGIVNSSDAFNASEVLSVSGFPFVGVVIFRNIGESGTLGNQLKPILVSRIDGLENMTPEALISSMPEHLLTHDYVQQSMQRENSELEANRQLRAQQAQAYEASLAQDLERARQAQEAEERERMEREEAKRKEQEILNMEKKMIQWRRWAQKALVKPEPTGGSKDRVTKISFRLESGKRVIRKFDGNNPVEDLYIFADTAEIPDLSEESTSSESNDNPETINNDQPPDPDYKHVFDFNLVSTFPRHRLEISQKTIYEALSEAKLWPNASFIVELLDEEEYEKKGINLGAAKANGQLAFIDGLTRIGDRLNTRKYSVIGSNAVQPDHQPSSTIKPFPIYNDTQATKTNNVDCNNDPSLEWINSLLEEIQGHLYVPNKTHDDPSVKNYLIIDDINIMLDVGVPLYAVQTFIQACQSMAAQNDGVLVILAHADEELREEYVEPFDDLASFLGNMYQLSDYVLQLDGLTTGYSHDVSGQLTAARGSLCKDSDFQPTVLHYSIQEKGTKFFAPGAAHDVL